MKSKFAGKALAVLLAAMLLTQGGCNLLPEEETGLVMPVSAPEEVSYATQVVERGDIVNKVSGVCYVVAKSQYDMSFEDRGGYLAMVEASQGMDVKKGDTLAALDVESLEIDIAKKQLSIKKMELELEQALDVKEEDNSLQISKLELQLESLNLGLEELKDQLREAKDNNAEEGEINAIRTKINQQRLSIQQVMLDLGDASKEEEEQRNYASEYKEIDLEIARLELQDLYDSLSKAVIVAPIDGRVVFVDDDIAVGDYINAQKHLISVADTTALLFEYTGSRANDIKLGMEATLKVSGKEMTASVVQTPSSVPAEEKEVYQDTIRFQCPELPEGLALGARADFSIILEEKQDVIMVPKTAVTKYMGAHYVSVMNEDGLRSERDVEVGIESATHYEIVSGLEAGETLIIE